MATPIPPTARRLRGMFLLLGAGLLVWIPFEDSHLGWVILFATLMAILAMLQLGYAIHQQPWVERLPLVARWSLAGIGAGLLIVPLALFLMAFKSGIHGHGRPDFSPEQVTAVLQRTPFFVLSATLCGIGIGFFHRFKSKDYAD